MQTITVIYSYRKAEETDREAIYQLYCLVMRGFVAEIWGWDELWQENDFSAYFDPKALRWRTKNTNWLGIPMSRPEVSSCSYE